MADVGTNVELPPWMIKMEDRIAVSVRNSRSFACKELLLGHSRHIVELVIVQEPCTKPQDRHKDKTPIAGDDQHQQRLLFNNSFRQEWLLQSWFLPTMQMQMQMWEESSSACLHCVKNAALLACIV